MGARHELQIPLALEINHQDQALKVVAYGATQLKDLFDPDSEMKLGENIVVDNGQIVAIESLSPNLVFKFATEQRPEESIRVESSRNPPENFRVGIGASI